MLPHATAILTLQKQNIACQVVNSLHTPVAQLLAKPVLNLLLVVLVSNCPFA